VDPAARAYASAILAIAKAEGEVGQVQDELFRFARILQQQGDLLMALTDSTRAVADRQRLVSQLLEGKVSKSTMASISLLLGANQIKNLDVIVESVLELAAEEIERMPVEIVVAEPISDEQLARLVSALSKILKKKLTPHVSVDPSILGGVRARVGDEVFDGSVRGRLERAKLALSSFRME
jgi:F-type H+-transporting ATPase subunit delta